MRVFLPLLLIQSIFLVACGSSSLTSEMPAKVYSYQCESGEVIEASYPSTELAIIEYKGKQHQMSISVAASGSRYVNNDLVWWTKGQGKGVAGTLFLHQNNQTGDLLETCITE
ncbi:MliC family protein [Marinospirillum insulare]|uniref:C-type lysozyme inhibitor domain-containing protein n=1 Tax=Marinospirillum insulare TaxID=217169 RepID=A0ABQ5ZXT6_9GAMM|nr:MliC family protein [Marinospirillum insulare]GLR64262.1 hypothetical protein GCM10007878_17000 [Marinospirillum insulare]